MLRTTRFSLAVMLVASLAGCRFGTDPNQLWHFRGTVINRTTSTPVPTVKVQAYYPGGCGFFGCSPTRVLNTVVTDANGRFSMDVDEGDGVCLGVMLTVVGMPSSEPIFGTVNDCEGKGDILNVTLWVSG